jgi:hypothetical protein
MRNVDKINVQINEVEDDINYHQNKVDTLTRRKRILTDMLIKEKNAEIVEARE